MPFFVNDPKHSHERAQESRALADAMRDPLARKQMLEAAEAYDRMAESAANRAIKTPLRP
jgi:hypothetical protein